ncbi:MAG: beta-ketoacyl synthase N-terminal-like domain-containing protein [Desulfobulbus sp.]
MTGTPVYIEAAGLVTPLGRGLDATETALRRNESAIAPLQVFSLLQGTPLPVGQIFSTNGPPHLPRTHQLAREAVRMILDTSPGPPEALILGCTTGGILTTEQLLRTQEQEKAAYLSHGLHSLSEDLAAFCGCLGPIVAISNACSSGAAAIALALRMLRRGQMRRILVGGVDSLSRLTYFGFHSLQLVDANGCHPLDADRRGLAVAEGAAFLLLTSDRPPRPLATVLGAGLSCDAHHATAPHPEGCGAQAAMAAALEDADLLPTDIDYISLHGTGTPENDRAEARAINSLFCQPPPLSSIKGALGHSLAASGAIEAVISALNLAHGWIPGNIGLNRLDPSLHLTPQLYAESRPLRTVLSNSFGFGGNNGCLVFGRADIPVTQQGCEVSGCTPLAVHGWACCTGAGDTEQTLAALFQGKQVRGMIDNRILERDLPPRLIRRLQRLPRLALAMAREARQDGSSTESPTAVFMGTGWGPLSETYDFLDKLATSSEQFPSPTDFVGSVHNSPAGQIAMYFKATGANITTSGQDHSFEQALLSAQTMLDENANSPVLLIGADEAHPSFSPLLDPSIRAGCPLADGGGALIVNRDRSKARCLLHLAFSGRGPEEHLVSRLIDALGGSQRIARNTGAVLAGIPRGYSAQGIGQLQRFLHLVEIPLPVWHYRDHVGEFASASAVAAVLASSFITAGKVPGTVFDTKEILLRPGQDILVLGTGPSLSAMVFSRP